MASIDVPLKAGGFGSTRRTDNWWQEPLVVLLGYVLFMIYATYAAFHPDCAGRPCYEVPGTNYVSPVFSPLLATEAPFWWPSLLPFSGALLILWAPGGFRFTCYFNRGAYYKSFWADPISCAVGEPGFRGKNYRGERWFPLVMQNLHRYFLYLAIILVVLHTYDALRAFFFDGRFGVGLGTLLMVADVAALSMYVFGCHSFRHLIGGRKDVMSQAQLTKKCYDCSTSLNKNHGRWQWVSMYFIVIVDLYVRLLATGAITDVRIVL
ncbi:MAG: succinate dehydrogenase [Acidobacteriota bacterium]